MSYPGYPPMNPVEPSYPPYPSPQGFGMPEMGPPMGAPHGNPYDGYPPPMASMPGAPYGGFPPMQPPMYPPGPPGGGFGPPGPPGGGFGPPGPPGGGFGPPAFGMVPMPQMYPEPAMHGAQQPFPGYPSAYPGMPVGAPPPHHPDMPMAAAAIPIYTDMNRAYQPTAPGELHVEERHSPKLPDHEKETPKITESHEPKDEGTIKPHHPFEPKEDATALKKAMKGLGTNEKAIIEILTNRSGSQRVDIVKEYKGMFGKDLISSLKKELRGDFESAVVALMKPRSVFLADALHKAMSGAGTKERVLIEILCTATNKEIHEINEAYRTDYGHPLEKSIKGDTSGYLENLLVAINVGNRSESHEVHSEKAEEDAAVLYKAGEKKWGTNESAFTVMLVSESYAQLRCMFEEYEKLAKHSFQDALKKEFSGSLLDAVLAIVKCVRNKAEYFAEQMYGAIKPMGTHDHTLIRLVISRSEIDLKLIKEEYQTKYKKSLYSAISSETSGDYKKVLLAIVKN